MSPDSLKKHGMKRHFNNEVAFLSHLNHKNIVRVVETASLVQMLDPFSQI
jgi:hypothetical protein